MNMNKPILIDALHICMGGGLMILNHLIDNIVEADVDVVLLKDSRCPALKSESRLHKVEVLSSDNNTRNAYYRKHPDSFSTVLCFGNIPPAIKVSVPVHTYIHNVSLLKIPSDYNISTKIKSYLKKLFIRHYAKNTDTWIVQTANTASLVRKHLASANQPILEYPFYFVPESINRVPFSERTDYIFVGECTMAKGHQYLVEAWVKLAQLGIDAPLHLTVEDPDFSKEIELACTKGANIINHGHIPFNEVVELYNKCKATVYPSLNESLELGIIEAAEAGCDVIGCDLPYIHCICHPSETFLPRDVETIVNAVMRYERTVAQKTILSIKDKVKPFIKFLCQYSNL